MMMMTDNDLLYPSHLPQRYTTLDATLRTQNTKTDGEESSHGRSPFPPSGKLLFVIVRTRYWFQHDKERETFAVHKNNRWWFLYDSTRIIKTDESPSSHETTTTSNPQSLVSPGTGLSIIESRDVEVSQVK